MSLSHASATADNMPSTAAFLLFASSPPETIATLLTPLGKHRNRAAEEGSQAVQAVQAVGRGGQKSGKKRRARRARNTDAADGSRQRQAQTGREAARTAGRGGRETHAQRKAVGRD